MGHLAVSGHIPEGPPGYGQIRFGILHRGKTGQDRSSVMERKTQDASILRQQVPFDVFRPISGDVHKAAFIFAFNGRFRPAYGNTMIEHGLAALGAGNPGLVVSVTGNNDFSAPRDMGRPVFRGADTGQHSHIFPFSLDADICQTHPAAPVVDSINFLIPGDSGIFCYDCKFRFPGYRYMGRIPIFFRCRSGCLTGTIGNAGDLCRIDQTAVHTQIHRYIFQSSRGSVFHRQCIHMGLLRFLVVIGIRPGIALYIHDDPKAAFCSLEFCTGMQQIGPHNVVECSIGRDPDVILSLKLQGRSVKIIPEYLVAVCSLEVLLDMALEGNMGAVHTGPLIGVMACIDPVNPKAMAFGGHIHLESVSDIRLALVPSKEPIGPNPAVFLDGAQMEIFSRRKIRAFHEYGHTHDGSRRFIFGSRTVEIHLHPCILSQGNGLPPFVFKTVVPGMLLAAEDAIQFRPIS